LLEDGQLGQHELLNVCVLRRFGLLSRGAQQTALGPILPFESNGAVGAAQCVRRGGALPVEVMGNESFFDAVLEEVSMMEKQDSSSSTDSAK
jgi:hypothetical protein